MKKINQETKIPFHPAFCFNPTHGLKIPFWDSHRQKHQPVPYCFHVYWLNSISFNKKKNQLIAQFYLKVDKTCWQTTFPSEFWTVTMNWLAPTEWYSQKPGCIWYRQNSPRKLLPIVPPPIPPRGTPVETLALIVPTLQQWRRGIFTKRVFSNQSNVTSTILVKIISKQNLV